MKTLRFVSLFLILFYAQSHPLYAQLSLGSNSQPATPQAAALTRYGGHIVNLYTGRMTLSIPIGEYRDKDFTIPVSLEYNYNGMRPNEQAGECGLGWMLSCGGMITREVVGIPDEETGAFCILPGTALSSTPILPHDDYPFSSTEPDVVLVALGVGEDADLAVTALYPGSGGSFYDASSDIYHFRMPGHSGSFFRRADGSFAVFDTGGNAGTYSVQKQNAWASNGQDAVYYNSQITVTTGDGYRYVFGSLEQADAYTERVWPGKESDTKKGAIIAWRLREIVSPGGEEVFFYYGGHGADGVVQHFGAERWISIGGSSTNHALSGTTHYSTYAPLSDVEGPGGSIHFHYGEKEADHSGVFITRPGLRALNPTLATWSLDSVEVNDVMTRLTYTYNANGNPYPFLAEVHTDGTGSWKMTYESLYEGYFPPFWTVATDHWGYLNQATKYSCDNQIVTWSTVSTTNGYQETLGTAKSPDTTAVRLGLLTNISYPAGGSTAFSYEANRYSRAVIKVPSNSYAPADLVETGFGPGVRITRIENRDADGTLTDAQAFSYGTGRLLSWPRYRIGYGGSVLNVPVSVQYATTGGLHRPGSVLLEYPSVTMTRLDGSHTEYAFADWTTAPDILCQQRNPMQRAVLVGGGLYGFGYMQGISYPGYLYNILEPLSSLQHYRGVPLSTAEFASGGNAPALTETWSYAQAGEPESTTEFINVGDACARVKHFGGEPRSLSHTSSTRYGQDSVTTVTRYAYNALGQVIDERTGSSAGDSLRTGRTFPKDHPSDAVLAAMAAGNFVDYPVTEARLRKRAGASAWDTVSAVRYTYLPYTNALDSTAFAVSAIHRRQDDGSWLTEATFLYDDKGNVIQRNDADGIPTAYVWNGAFGVSIVVENASRQQVEACLAQSPATDITNTADAAARLRARLTQARVSDYDYLRLGLPTRMTDPAGHTLFYEYDENDRLVAVRDSTAGVLQQFHYSTATR